MFGFDQTNFTAVEQDDVYNVEFGFFSGVAVISSLVTIELTLGTASKWQLRI